MNSFAIIGAGGHGTSLMQFFLDDSINGTLLGFIDDNAGRKVQSYSVIHSLQKLLEGEVHSEVDAYLLAFGENNFRRKIYEKLHSHIDIPTVIHKTAFVSETVRLGKGCQIFGNSYLNISCELGDNSIINTGSILEHEVTIGANSNISPSVTISGQVNIGNNVFIGTGAAIRNNIEIGDNVIIGMGAVVISDISANSMALGNPAKIVKSIPDDYKVY